MGSFYTNISVVGADAATTRTILSGLNRDAYVLECGADCIVFDKQCDDQDTEVLGALADHLSSQLHCTAFAVLNHDDDILWFQLYRDGELLSEYANRASPPTSIGALLDAFSVKGQRLRLWFTLKRPYVFQVMRHDRLATILGLPMASVGSGFQYIDRGEIPDGAAPDRLHRVLGKGGQKVTS